MRLHLAKLGLATVVVAGACSLIYNPDHIKLVSDAKEFMDAPPPDVEMIVDANPTAIGIGSGSMAPYPAQILEGAGAAGTNSRPAIVILQGHDFDAGRNPAVEVTGDATLVDFKVAADHNWIAIALDVALDSGCTTPTTKPLTIKVSQDNGAGGRASAMTTDVSIKCLPELTVTNPFSSSSLYDSGKPILFSQINVGNITFAPAAGSPPAIFRSASSITIGDITASGSGASPGPGGGAGGDDGATGSGPSPGAGSNNGGGGGGFAAMGTNGGNTGNAGAGGAVTGQPYVIDYSTNASSGGGGGSPGALGTAHTSQGGAGGGSVELTASGDVTVGTITAAGADGTMGDGATLASAGGGGTGGLVVLRSGHALNVAGISVANGAGGGASGGAGSVGRVRIDTATTAGTAPTCAAPSCQLAPNFVNAPTVVTGPNGVFSFTLSGQPAATTAVGTLRVFDVSKNIISGPHDVNISPNGTGTVSDVSLHVGWNRVCVTMMGGTPDPDAKPEANNCIEVGYAP